MVWNLDKILNSKAEQFDAKQAAQGRGRIPTVAEYQADMTGLNKDSTQVYKYLNFDQIA